MNDRVGNQEVGVREDAWSVLIPIFSYTGLYVLLLLFLCFLVIYFLIGG